MHLIKIYQELSETFLIEFLLTNVSALLFRTIVHFWHFLHSIPLSTFGLTTWFGSVLVCAPLIGKKWSHFWPWDTHLYSLSFVLGTHLSFLYLVIYLWSIATLSKIVLAEHFLHEHLKWYFFEKDLLFTYRVRSIKLLEGS